MTAVDVTKFKPLDQVEMDDDQRKFLAGRCGVDRAYRDDEGYFIVAKRG